MKRLTALATIGLPFTVVSGYFGMNFEVMPWLKEPWGIVAASALMVAISGSVLLFFKRSGWL
jgi:magnesium transporter